MTPSTARREAATWSVLAAASPAFWVTTRLATLPDAVQFATALAFGALGLALALWSGRRARPGDASPPGRLHWAARAYVATMLLVAAVVLLGQPMADWLIPLALTPAIPAAIAAWSAIAYPRDGRCTSIS